MTAWPTVESETYASKMVRLGDILDVQNGFAFSSKSFTRDGEVGLIRIRDLKNGERTQTRFSGEYSPDYLVRAGDLLIGMDGEFRCYQWRGEPALLNQRVCRLINFTEDVVPEYLLFVLNEHLKQIEDVTGYATVKHLSSKTIKEIELPLPTVAEQKRIAGVLDRTRDKVAEYSGKLEEIQGAHSALRRAYIDSLFESLDARSEPLAEVCDVFTDGDWIESKDQSPAGIRLVQTGNIGNGVFRDRLEKARWISPATFDRLRCTELLPGDVVFSRLPEPVGRACLIPDNGTKMITAVDCTITRPDEAVLLPRFLLLYASSSAYFREVQSMVTGTTRDRISRKNLGRVRIPIPSIATQQELLSAAHRAEAGFISLESSVERGLQCAEELSAAVLAAAFRGDL